MLKIQDRGERLADLGSAQSSSTGSVLSAWRGYGCQASPSRRHGSYAIGSASNNSFAAPSPLNASPAVSPTTTLWCERGELLFLPGCASPRSFLGIDRRNEVVCHELASGLGIAPDLIHQEEGLLVTRFIDGKTLAPVGPARSQLMQRLAVAPGQAPSRVGRTDRRDPLLLPVSDRAHLCRHGRADEGIHSGRSGGSAR